MSLENFSKEEIQEDFNRPPAIPPNIAVSETEKVEASVDESKLLSKQDLINDIQYQQDYLQWREDRVGTKKTVGASYVAIPFLKQELTAENIVDDAIDTFRFDTSNEINAAQAIDFLQSTVTKEKEAVENYNNATTDADRKKYQAQATKFAEQRARAARIYKKTNRLAGIFNSKRYEGQSLTDNILDAVDAVGGHLAANVSSPLFVLSLGIGKEVVKYTGTKLAGKTVAQYLIGIASTASIDMAQAGIVDHVVQGAEIEMGIRDGYDTARTLTAMGTSAFISGTLTAYSVRNMLKSPSMESISKNIREAVQKVQDGQMANAKAKIASNKDLSSFFEKNFLEDLQVAYGKDAVIKNADGTLKEFNEEAIKEFGRKKIKELAKGKLSPKNEVIEPAMNKNMYTRFIGAATEIFEIAQKDISAIVEKDVPLESLVRTQKLLNPKLKKGEKISSRIFEILTDKNIKKDLPYEILGKYGVTANDMSAMLLAQSSEYAKGLAALSVARTKLSRANRKVTAEEAAEEAAEVAVKNKFDETWLRLENARRAALVSGVATAMRNGLAQVPRVGIDTLIYGLESAMDPTKTFSRKATMAQMKYTFFDNSEAAVISDFLLDNFSEAKRRMWSQYSEVKQRVGKRNPNQEVLSNTDVDNLGKPKFLQKEKYSPISIYEGAIHHFNIFNRFQESLFRRGGFMASIERQLVNQGKDLDEVLTAGTFVRDIDEKMMAKAVDDALEFSFAAQPEFAPFAVINNLITKSRVGTLLIPFPRFMMKAMEMSYNYSVFGAATGLTRVITRGLAVGSNKTFKERMKSLSTKGDSFGRFFGTGKNAGTKAYKQLAQGIVGTSILMPLGYLLRDPENDVAGSEWYKLKDGMGNEFDARVYGPIITPYLLMGEIMHRMQRGLPWTDASEILEGVTGANFRSFYSIDKTGAELIRYFQSGQDDDLAKSMAAVGRILGEASSGYLQPFYQFGDLRAEADRKRDYKENPVYEDGMDAFLQEFSLPFKRRIDAFVDNPEIPYSASPVDARIPERILPFMKVIFGATLNRVPPDYIAKLGQLGFGYKDFMAKSAFPEVNRVANKLTAEGMQEQMPTLLHNLFEVEKMKDNEAIGIIQGFVSSLKQDTFAEARAIKEDDNQLLTALMKYKRLPVRNRVSAKAKWKKANPDREIDMNNYEIVTALFLFGRQDSERGKAFRTMPNNPFRMPIK